MKKIPKDIHIELPAVKLFLDEIEEIYRQFESVKPDRIETTLGDYLIEEFSDISKLPIKSVTHYDIKIFRPFHCHFRAGSSNTNIYASGSDVTARGLVAVLNDIASKNIGWLRRAKALPLTQFILWGFLIPILAAISGILSYALIFREFDEAGAIGFFVIWSVLYFRLFSYIESRITGLLILTRRENMPNFFKRNKDRIVLDLAIAIISAMLGVWIGR